MFLNFLFDLSKKLDSSFRWNDKFDEVGFSIYIIPVKDEEMKNEIHIRKIVCSVHQFN